MRAANHVTTACFFSVMQLLVVPTNSEWLSSLASGDLLFQSTSLVFNVTVRCSAAGSNVTFDRFVRVTVPCPALPRTLASDVTTGVAALQWISAVGGPGASGAMGRVMVVRSLELCSAAGGPNVTIDLDDCTAASAKDNVGGLLGNLVIIVVTILLLLVVCRLLAPADAHRALSAAVVAGARSTAFPSTLLPLATTLLPTTAALVIVVLRDLGDISSSTAACQVSVTVFCAVVALCFCAVSVAASIGVHFVTTSHLVVLETPPVGCRGRLNRLQASWRSKRFK